MTLPSCAPVETSATVRPAFVVMETAVGRWLARDRQRGIARIFASRREALHFALFETGAARAVVLHPPGG